MPSSPDSGPIMIWTLSCSTALRVALTALSGVASDETLTNSIFLPPAMPLLLLERQVGAAHAVLARRRERSFQGGQQADLQRLLRLGAARPRDAAAAAPTMRAREP